MVPMFTRLPDLAARETRTVEVRGYEGLPDDEYEFVEYYCDEEACDCRRVILSVRSRGSPGKVWATIGFGWEKVGFYRKWAGVDTKEALRMKGPVLDPLNPQSQCAGGLLGLFREIVCDREYEARLRNHYRLFKSRMNTVEAILEALDVNRGYFPEEAAALAVARYSLIKPHLLEILRQTVRNAEELSQRQDYFAHIYALYIFGQFQDGDAYPLIVDLLRLPDSVADELIGDTSVGDLDRILASVSGTDFEPIKSLIEDSAVNKWVRSAAVRSIALKLMDGHLLRQDVVDYFRYLLRNGLEPEADVVWDSVVSSSVLIHPGELIAEIRTAYERELVNPFYIKLEDIEQCVGVDPHDYITRKKGKGNSSAIDVIAGLSCWACFNPPAKFMPPWPDPKDSMDLDSNPSSLDLPSKASRGAPKTGRNSPCPCGSGKKYKKCCGA